MEAAKDWGLSESDVANAFREVITGLCRLLIENMTSRRWHYVSWLLITSLIYKLGDWPRNCHITTTERFPKIVSTHSIQGSNNSHFIALTLGVSCYFATFPGGSSTFSGWGIWCTSISVRSIIYEKYTIYLFGMCHSMLQSEFNSIIQISQQINFIAVYGHLFYNAHEKVELFLPGWYWAVQRGDWRPGVSDGSASPNRRNADVSSQCS